MLHRLRRQIAAELEQLSRLIEIHRPLLEQTALGPPTPVETSALGAMLHSFYNGVENIFKRIALELDGQMPNSRTWHRDLLNAMARPGPGRRAVISEELREQLNEYLNFRHVFRSAYSFLIEWERMAPLALNCVQVFELLSAELQSFLSDTS